MVFTLELNDYLYNKLLNFPVNLYVGKLSEKVIIR